MDEIIRAVSKDGFVKISVVTARDAVQRANAIHHCSPTAIAALGRSLCAASMLGDLLKEENGTLTLRISGGGGLGSIIAVSDSEGNVRGMVSNPAFDLPTRPDGKLDVGGAVGKDGMLTVSRDIGLRRMSAARSSSAARSRRICPLTSSRASRSPRPAASACSSIPTTASRRPAAFSCSSCPARRRS